MIVKRSLVWVVLMFLFLGILLSANLVLSQEDASINGYVRDQNNYQPIYGARIIIEDTTDPMNRYEIYTDSNGYYSEMISEGNYKVTISANGYDDEVNDGVYLSDGDYQDIYLSPSYDGYDGDGYDGFDEGDDGYDGGGDGRGDGEEDGNGSDPNIDDFIPMGLQENGAMYIGVCLIFVIVLFVSFIIMACSSLGIFVRLGKIKKDIKKLRENQRALDSQAANSYPPPRHHSEPEREYSAPRGPHEHESRSPPPRDYREDDRSRPPPRDYRDDDRSYQQPPPEQPR